LNNSSAVEAGKLAGDTFAWHRPAIPRARQLAASGSIFLDVTMLASTVNIVPRWRRDDLAHNGGRTGD